MSVRMMEPGDYLSIGDCNIGHSLISNQSFHYNENGLAAGFRYPLRFR